MGCKLTYMRIPIYLTPSFRSFDPPVDKFGI
jgi:hypothetical protein